MYNPVTVIPGTMQKKKRLGQVIKDSLDLVQGLLKPRGGGFNHCTSFVGIKLIEEEAYPLMHSLRFSSGEMLGLVAAGLNDTIPFVVISGLDMMYCTLAAQVWTRCDRVTASAGCEKSTATQASID